MALLHHEDDVFRGESISSLLQETTIEEDWGSRTSTAAAKRKSRNQFSMPSKEDEDLAHKASRLSKQNGSPRPAFEEDPTRGEEFA
mmetsp:Transcript_20923/g.59688  ORF Transcript_20923/g.59688 Transcript_20923/m.59688 type:complete len:86 (+) Transcript_20923:447-704(+)